MQRLVCQKVIVMDRRGGAGARLVGLWPRVAIVLAALVVATLFAASPPAATGGPGPLADDSFNRTVAAGWGNADTGGFPSSPSGSSTPRLWLLRFSS